MTLGAIVITGVALFVGLGGLYLAWRFVDGLPTDRPGEPLELQGPKPTEPDLANESDTDSGDRTEQPTQRRSRASEWLAGAAIALGLVGLAVFLIRELGSR